MSKLSRRRFVGAGALAAAAAALPWGSKLLAAGPSVTTWRDPNCGCCHKWVEAMRKAGFSVTVHQTSDIMGVKAKLGVPQNLASCHTSRVGGYVVEGHVPAAAIARLLRTRQKNVVGIAVLGMPRGAPGMEMPDGSKDAFAVLAFDSAGRTSRFA